MNRKKIYSAVIVAVIGVPLIAFALVRHIESNFLALPYYAEDFSKIDKDKAKKVESFTFINQDSIPINGDFMDGKVWVACYFFTTCPGICPIMIDGMREIQQEFFQEENLRLLSFTVNPEIDNPKVLKQYANIRNVNTKQWNFVTGSKKELYRYARKELNLTATDGDGGLQDFIHSDRLVLIDQENYIRGYYDGTDASEVEQLAIDIKKLLSK